MGCCHQLTFEMTTVLSADPSLWCSRTENPSFSPGFCGIGTSMVLGPLDELLGASCECSELMRSSMVCVSVHAQEDNFGRVQKRVGK